MKSRLQAYENLFVSLQTKTQDEAFRVLQRIRSADDIVRFFGDDADTPSSQSSAPATSSSSPATDSSLAVSARRSSQTTISKPDLSTITVDAAFDISGGTSLPRMPHWPNADASAYVFSLVIPSPKLTWAAVESFFCSCGSLFHIFSPAQVEQFQKLVFGLDGRPNFLQKAAICCLCAVAAVGIQYNPSDFEQGAEQIFYDVSRHFFTDVVEEQPLEAIKVCALFALYNILGKETAALAYVGE